MNPLLVGPLLELGKGLIGKLFTDPEKKVQAELALLQMQQNGELKELDAALQVNLAQLEVNKEEAKSTSNFRGGWRPFIGWVCGLGLAYQFLLHPLANGVFMYLTRESPMPDLDSATLMTLVTGMLGLGGLRTFEKTKGMK